MAERWEPRDIAIRPIAIFAAVLFPFLIAVGLGASALVGFLAGREGAASPRVHPLAPAVGTALPPAPRLQSAPRKDLEQLRAEEDAVLSSYGWVDQGAGVARIPIERAMALRAERAVGKAGR
jgi:hypothetical protein